jgi:hypothetical protein
MSQHAMRSRIGIDPAPIFVREVAEDAVAPAVMWAHIADREPNSDRWTR